MKNMVYQPAMLNAQICCGRPRSLEVYSFAALLGLVFLLSGCGEIQMGLAAATDGISIPSTDATTDVVLTTSLSIAIPAGRYDGTKMCSVSSPNLIASNIKDGVTILGILGTYADSGGGSTALHSNIHRDSGQAAWRQSKESSDDAGQNYTLAIYRAVPDITKDDDGYTGGSVTSVNRTGWGAATCGTSQATIEGRIADCAGHGVIGSNATWDGTIKGNAGQAVWKLVTRSADLHSSGRAREVWRDERTGLLWSSLVTGLGYLDDSQTAPTDDGKSLNWCKASGSNNIVNNTTAQADPISWCDDSSNQTTGTGPTDKAVSACFEDGENFFTTNDPKIDNAGKAGLGYSSTPKVAWRLPSRYDYVQAEADGIRFVLPDNVNKRAFFSEWAATVLSNDRNYAWTFEPFFGGISYSSRGNYSNAARCVGR